MKGILNTVTWDVRGSAFNEEELDDILAKKNIKHTQKREIRRVHRNKQLS